MQKLLLLVLAALFAVVLVFPLLAEEAEPSPVSHADVAQEAVGETLTRAEAALLEAAAAVDSPAAQGLAGFLSYLIRVEIFGLSVGHLIASFLIFFFSLLFRNVISQAVIARLLRFADRSSLLDARFVAALTRPFSLFLLIFGVYLALLVLPLGPFAGSLVSNLFRGLTMLTVVWAALLLSDVLADHLERRLSAHPQAALAGFAPLVKKSLKIFVLIIGVLMTIDNLGYNITGILATLGLGTAAVALASQDTIKNAFGAMMIALDRPFKVGDWIQVGDKVDGDVESIGLRSTKVRTWPKTVISIPNGVLANEFINNWSQMPKRRVKQTIGITYEATAEDMENLVEDFRAILREDEGVEQQFILVNFTDFGESSLDILVYYFTKSTAWLEYMDVRQRINCRMMRAIQARGLSVAFPTRSLYLDGPAASRLAGMEYESRWGGGEPSAAGPDAPL